MHIHIYVYIKSYEVCFMDKLKSLINKKSHKSHKVTKLTKDVVLNMTFTSHLIPRQRQTSKTKW